MTNQSEIPAKIRCEITFAETGVLGENRIVAEQDSRGFTEKLQRLVETVDVANVLTEPLSRSIESLLRVSAAQIDCDEASVLVRDGDEGNLRFLSAIGKVADQLLNIRVPAGKGIAGFVFSSGQPMVISDVAEDQSFYAEVDKKTGYSTQMILATPLNHGGEMIGVLEYVNRRGTPPFTPFTPEEMDRAAAFAEAIAALVHAYQSAKLFRDLGGQILGETDSDTADVRAWLEGLRESPSHQRMMDLAVLVREVASRGEAEGDLTREVLESVLKYSDSKDDFYNI